MDSPVHRDDGAHNAWTSKGSESACARDHASHTSTAQEADSEAGRLETLLDRIVHAGSDNHITLDDALAAVGQSSFGALILVPALILVSPLSGIPGLPTALGTVIFLVCVQYLVGRNRLWLPARLRRTGFERDRLKRSVDKLRPSVRWLDRLVKPRLTFLINRITLTVVAAVCALIALVFPPLEALPFVTSAGAAVIALYGFAILANDGAVGIVAVAVTGLGVAGGIVFVVPLLVEIVT